MSGMYSYLSPLLQKQTLFHLSFVCCLGHWDQSSLKEEEDATHVASTLKPSIRLCLSLPDLNCKTHPQILSKGGNQRTSTQNTHLNREHHSGSWFPNVLYRSDWLICSCGEHDSEVYFYIQDPPTHTHMHNLQLQVSLSQSLQLLTLTACVCSILVL